MSSSVRSALVQAFLDLKTAQGWDYEIITENRPKTPDGKSIYMGLTYLPNIPTVQTLGDGGEDDLTG